MYLKKLYQLQKLLSSPNIRVIKSRMVWAGHVARKKMRNVYYKNCYSENLMGKRNLGNVGMTFTLGDRLGQDEVVVSVTTVMNI
jgi:hypothetical protein